MRRDRLYPLGKIRTRKNTLDRPAKTSYYHVRTSVTFFCGSRIFLITTIFPSERLSSLPREKNNRLVILFSFFCETFRRLFLFSPVEKSYQDRDQDQPDDDLLKVCENHIRLIRSKIPDREQEQIPASSPKSRIEYKREKIHPKGSCRKRDQLTNCRNKTPDKGRNRSSFSEELLCLCVVIERNKYIFSILFYQLPDDRSTEIVPQGVVNQ